MRRIVLAGLVLAIFGAAGCGSAGSPRQHTTATQTENRERVTLGTEFDLKHHTWRSTTPVVRASGCLLCQRGSRTKR